MGAHEAANEQFSFGLKIFDDEVKLLRNLKDMLCVIFKTLHHYRPLTEQVGVVGVTTNGTRCKIYQMRHKGRTTIVHSKEYELPTRHQELLRIQEYIHGLTSASALIDQTQKILTRPEDWLTDSIQEDEYFDLDSRGKDDVQAIFHCNDTPQKPPRGKGSKNKTVADIEIDERLGKF